ncbi:MAG: hypothetical protein WBD19_01555, partial [Candidatus Acidiferrum sp.]
MKRRLVLLTCAAFLLSCSQFIFSAFAGGKPGDDSIRYEISLDHPESHLFHVTMNVPDVEGELTVQMPAWNALYQIRDFSSHVQQVEAHAGTEELSI